MSRRIHSTFREQLADGGPSYFHPLGALPSEAETRERTLKLRAAQALLQRAWPLANTWSEHTVEDYQQAAALYDEAALAFDAITGRAYEAKTARYEARRCRENVALARGLAKTEPAVEQLDDVKKGTGT